MNSEIISKEQMHEEYIMLALRSSGLDLNDYRKYFSDAWIKKNNPYFELLKNEHHLTIDDNLIKLTSKGYAVCDEILKNIL